MVSKFLAAHVTGHHNHACDSPSTSDNKVEGRKGKVKFPCKLCGGMHLTYHCPHIEEPSQLLEVGVITHQQYPVASQESSPTLHLVDDVVNLFQYSVTSTSPSAE